MKNKIYLHCNAENNSYFFDYLHQAEKAFIEYFICCKEKKTYFLPIKRLINKSLLRILRVFSLAIRIPVFQFSDHSRFSFLCGPDFGYCLPEYFFSRKKYLYIYDAWPRDNSDLVSLAKFYGVTRIFFSSLQSAENYNLLSDCKNGFWVPEGINSEYYSHKEVKDKDVDVIAFGRQSTSIHSAIYENGKNKINYLFSKDEILDLSNALSRSKISICMPSSITHPIRSENISTMTLRYLQSMISKALILGELPYDMQFLFDYNPVIQINREKPFEQIVEILANYDDYLPLIQRNYDAVMTKHLWQNRFSYINDLIS